MLTLVVTQRWCHSPEHTHLRLQMFEVSFEHEHQFVRISRFRHQRPALAYFFRQLLTTSTDVEIPPSFFNRSSGTTQRKLLILLNHFTLFNLRMNQTHSTLRNGKP